MSDPERRGRRLFFMIAAVLLLDSLSPLLLQFWLVFANVAWFRQVILPLIRAAAIVWLWQGERFLVWLVAGAAVVSGLGDLSGGAFVLIPLLQVGGPAAAGALPQIFGVGLFYVVWGLLKITAGLLLLLSPSLKAFFIARKFSLLMTEAVRRLESEKATAEPVPVQPRNTVIRHPEVDFEHWKTVFPMEMLINTSGPQRFDTTDPSDPLDLWKIHGTPITSPAQLCMIELVRKQCAGADRRGAAALGPALPVDLLLWSVEPARRPWLTRLGGTPHRESTKPWPTHDGSPCTFVCQFCFVDSADIVPEQLPGKVMLVFLADEYGYWDPAKVHIEFSSVKLRSPMTAEQCPRPSFVVPQLSGHIHRTCEYPRGERVFYKAGHWLPWFFSMTGCTKIGRRSFHVDEPGLVQGEQECLCALHSFDYLHGPLQGFWPLIGLETFPEGFSEPHLHDAWGRFSMQMGDVGCLYFLIDKQGAVTSHFFSH